MRAEIVTGDVVVHSEVQFAVDNHGGRAPHGLDSGVAQLAMRLGISVDHHEVATFFLEHDQLAIGDHRRRDCALAAAISPRRELTPLKPVFLGYLI